jgi:hypothetical protein
LAAATGPWEKTELEKEVAAKREEVKQEAVEVAKECAEIISDERSRVAEGDEDSAAAAVSFPKEKNT